MVASGLEGDQITGQEALVESAMGRFSFFVVVKTTKNSVLKVYQKSP